MSERGGGLSPPSQRHKTAVLRQKGGGDCVTVPPLAETQNRPHASPKRFCVSEHPCFGTLMFSEHPCFGATVFLNIPVVQHPHVRASPFWSIYVFLLMQF